MLSSGEKALLSDADDDKRSDLRVSALSDGQVSVTSTVVYYLLLGVGAVAWWKLLWPLSQSGMSLTSL